jgi:hypothetical protein
LARNQDNLFWVKVIGEYYQQLSRHNINPEYIAHMPHPEDDKIRKAYYVKTTP